MTDQSAKISLSFAVRPGNLVPEAEACGFFAANPGALSYGPEQEGVVVVEGDGEPIAIGDVVLWMVPALCFDAVKSVLETGAATVDAFSNDTHVELHRDGQTIRVECSGAFPLTFPAQPLITALFATGQRFIALVEQLWPAQAASLLASVRPREAAAQASLSESYSARA